MINILLTIFFFVLILGFLVFVHELGHFTAARLTGVGVKQFALGFGPILKEKKKGETRYQLRAIPLGGFVELVGEHDTKTSNGFRSKGFFPKAFILSAGVLMNIIFAIVFIMVNLLLQDFWFSVPKFTTYQFSNVEKQVEAFPITVVGFAEESASKDDIDEFESITAINDEEYETFEEFRELLKKYAGEEVEMEFIDLDTLEFYTKEVTLGEEDEDGNVLQAALFYDSEANRPSYLMLYEKEVFSSIAQSYDITIYSLKSTGVILKDAFSTGDYERASDVAGSPVQLGEQINEFVEYDAYLGLFFLTGIISLSLAIFNILPFPALDGGQIVVAGIESIIRRPIPDNIVNGVNMVGFSFLMLFSLALIAKDLWQSDLLGIL